MKRNSLFLLAAALLPFSPVRAEDKPDSSYFKNGGAVIMNSSHQDLAWMNDIASCRDQRINGCILPAMEIIRKDPSYRYTMENMQNLVEFLEAHPEKRAELYDMMKTRRFEFGATYNQPYEAWYSGEQLVRETYFGRKWFKKEFPGCDAVTAFNPDVPGRALQMQQILAKAGIPYLVSSRFHEGMWKWKSPDGSGVIFFTPGQYGNDMAAVLSPPPAEGAKNLRAKMDKFAPEYARRGLSPVFPVLYSCDSHTPILFGGLIDFWNKNGPGSMSYSSTRDFFEAATKNGTNFREITGNRPDIWLYIHGPSHHREADAKRGSGVALPQAEIFQTVAALLGDGFASWPTGEFTAAWKNAICDDHGMGGHQGHITHAVFRRMNQAALDAGTTLRDRALAYIASRVATDSAKGVPVVVFNDLNWERDDLVEVPLPAGMTGVRVTVADGREVPSQIIRRDAEVNVAAATEGAKASSSSSFAPAYGPEHLIDGRWENSDPNRNIAESDIWASAKGAGPHRATVDFGQTRTIHRIVVKHGGATGRFGEEESVNTAQFTLETANSENGPWTPVAAVEGNKAALTRHEFAPRACRFVRLSVIKPTQGADTVSRICELEAYATLPETPKVSFLARAVPSVGCRTWYLRPAAAAVAPKDSTAPEVLENDFYKVVLAPGGVKSIFDKKLGVELLDTGKFLGGELFTMQSIGNGAGEFGRIQPVDMRGYLSTSEQKPVWKRVAEECGPLREVVAFELPLKNCVVREKLTLHRHLRRVDFDVEIRDWNGEKYREWRMAVPVAGHGQVAYEEPMGVVEIGKSEIPMDGGFAYGHLTYSDQAREIPLREVQHFMSADGDKAGITLSTSTAVFGFRDPTPNPVAATLLQPVLLASRKSCHALGNWYTQAGTHRFHYSLTSHEPGWRNGWRAGLAPAHPFLPVVGPKKTTASGAALPESCSFLSLDGGNTLLTTLKKCEDDNSVVARFVDMEGRDSRVSLRLMTPVKSAQRTNIIEEEGKPLPVADGGVRIDLGHHAIETLKLEPEPRR